MFPGAAPGCVVVAGETRRSSGVSGMNIALSVQQGGIPRPLEPLRLHISEEKAMNADVLKGKWKQLRGEVKQWWGDLTDDDFEKIDGERDKLVGRLQERYGYAKERAEAEVDQRLREYDRVAH
jgi:uncharacterized protein YjbJ (UPF0337 family)